MRDEILLPSPRVLETYRAAFRSHGRREEAVLWTKGKQAVRFAALCRQIENYPATLLDFGCGLGDLAGWLHMHRPALSYTGVDIVPDFIASNLENVPHAKFNTVHTAADIDDVHDHIVCSGVFNLDPEENPGRHWQHTAATLAALFEKTNQSLHVDFLAHDVAYRQPHSYHQDSRQLIQFVEQRLSKRYVLDRSYMPYEYCITVFKDTAIARPRNVYASADGDRHTADRP